MSAEYVDVAAVLDGYTDAPQTAVGGRRSDGTPLLYAGAVNVLLGAPEAGKTLVAGAMAADELFSGGRVLWIDLDHNGAPALLHRFREFGVDRDTLCDRARFRLAIPEDTDQLLAVVAESAGASLAVVDSIGELIPLFGANSNNADDYTNVNRQVLAAIAGKGAGVLGIDHEAKSLDSAAYGAMGTMAKKRAVDGALLRVTNIRPFRPGHGGEARLTVVKDRHGYLRSLTDNEREPSIATFLLESRGNALHARFLMPVPRVAAPDDVELLLELVPPPKSVRDVKERMRWGTGRSSDAFRAFQSVPGTAGNVPGTAGDASVPVFPPPRGGTGNAHREHSSEVLV